MEGASLGEGCRELRRRRWKLGYGVIEAKALRGRSRRRRHPGQGDLAPYRRIPPPAALTATATIAEGAQQQWRCIAGGDVGQRSLRLSPAAQQREHSSDGGSTCKRQCMSGGHQLARTAHREFSCAKVTKDMNHFRRYTMFSNVHFSLSQICCYLETRPSVRVHHFSAINWMSELPQVMLLKRT